MVTTSKMAPYLTERLKTIGGTRKYPGSSGEPVEVVEMTGVP